MIHEPYDEPYDALTNPITNPMMAGMGEVIIKHNEIVCNMRSRWYSDGTVMVH